MESKELRITLPPGRYKTEAGSTVRIFGKHGRASRIESDWFEESGACIDCKPEVDLDKGILVWNCESHAPGSARLIEDGGYRCRQRHRCVTS